MKIKLRLNVTTNDAKNIIMWLENKDVTKVLNEDKNSATSLQYIIESGQINLLRYYLNRDGRFFSNRLRKRKMFRIYYFIYNNFKKRIRSYYRYWKSRKIGENKLLYMN